MEDIKMLFRFTMKEHLRTGGAIVPEVVGNDIFLDEGSNFGADKFEGPAHIDLMAALFSGSTRGIAYPAG